MKERQYTVTGWIRFLQESEQWLHCNHNPPGTPPLGDVESFAQGFSKLNLPSRPSFWGVRFKFCKHCCKLITTHSSMNDTLYCKNDTCLNMYHLKNMFINEIMSLVIPLTMLIVGTKLGKLSSKQEKGVAKFKRSHNRKT